MDSEVSGLEVVSTLLFGGAAGVLSELYLADHWAMPAIFAGCFLGVAMAYSFRRFVALRLATWLLSGEEPVPLPVRED